MKKILIAVTVMISAASAAKAEVNIDFDGNSIRAVNFIKAVKDNEATVIQPTPVPSVNTLFSYNDIAEMDKITQSQPAIKAFVASYNQHVLHNAKVGADLQLEGIVIALKLPDQVLITKNGEVLDTINNVIMVNTIRHNLGGSGAAITRNKCVLWVLEVIAVWVVDHYVEKTVKKCSEWLDEQQPKPGSTPAQQPTQDQHPEQTPHWQHQY